MAKQVAAMAASLPRMRGDRPLYRYDIETDTAFTPHARGSTIYAHPVYDQDEVYPACAGIDPSCESN